MSAILRCRRISLLALTVLILLSCSAHAQQTVTSASLSGKVTDENGSIVAGSSLVITSLETNQTRNAITEADGRYHFAYLPVGSYQLLVTATGFATLKQTLTLSVGQPLELPVRLAVAVVSEQVTVRTDIPVIETARTQ